MWQDLSVDLTGGWQLCMATSHGGGKVAISQGRGKSFGNITTYDNLWDRNKLVTPEERLTRKSECLQVDVSGIRKGNKKKKKRWTQKGQNGLQSGINQSKRIQTFGDQKVHWWKNPPANAGGASSIPGWGRSPGGGNGNLLQCSCLENSMHRGAWRATVHGVTKSQTWLFSSERQLCARQKSEI